MPVCCFKRSPNSVTLNVALSDEAGQTLTLYTGYNHEFSTLRQDYANRANLGDEVTVQTRTLADVCDEYVVGAIDWLKIDVEGYERQVLAGGDWQKYRPQVICIESTEPLVGTRLEEEWIEFLDGYQQLHFDGLNTWFERMR